MAVISISTGLVEQPNETVGLSGGSRTFSRTFKGPWATVKAFAKGISEGDTLAGYPAVGVDARRVSGNYGEATVTLSAVAVSATEEGATRAERAAWSLRQVRNDVSILAYCGKGASRVALELWMKETDKSLADSFNFHTSDSATGTLSSLEQSVAKKVLAGVESVIRFYPVLTCTSTWAEIPSAFSSKLGFVDDPAAPAADKTLAPGDLSSVIAAHEWLKCQDDVAETADGKWRRTESWMGIKKTLGSWDSDLYGESGWKMPLPGS